MAESNVEGLREDVVGVDVSGDVERDGGEHAVTAEVCVHGQQDSGRSSLGCERGPVSTVHSRSAAWAWPLVAAVRQRSRSHRCAWTFSLPGWEGPSQAWRVPATTGVTWTAGRRGNERGQRDAGDETM